ncbi:MAG: alpha/beta fold hydrolase [Caldilineales bacterium]|nr:alpha/beta fold hydrolase [Caldilineales bacterium]
MIPPGDFNVDARHFQFPSHGFELTGFFYPGRGAGLRPTCVLIHGIPGNQKNLDMAEAMTELGWNAVVWSPRGSWGNGGTYSILGMREDLAALVAYLQATDLALDWGRLVLLGYSLGGAIAIQFIHSHPELARCLVLVAPTIDFLESSLTGEYASSVSPVLAGTTPESLQKMWMAEAWERNPIDLIAEVNIPILLIAGDRDEGTPIYLAESMAAAAPNCDLVILPGADHAFSGRRLELIETVTGWLSNTVGP